MLREGSAPLELWPDFDARLSVYTVEVRVRVRVRVGVRVSTLMLTYLMPI